MKSINRIITVCTVLFISFAVVTSLFILLTQDVQARNVSSVNVSGPIITNTTWTLAGSPYILNGVVTVNEGVTLTVEPGVMVMANTNSGFDIAGRLEAIGTPAQPITFTSVASATPGEWYGIFIGGNNGMGSAHLNNAVVQYADWNFSIYSEEGAPITKIENTTTRSSLYTGMEIYDSALHLVELDDVTFANNGGSNRIILREFDDNFSLGGNTTLKTQPGLEGYEVDFWDNDWGNFAIPAGITLTVEPGVSLYMERGGIDVNGRLEAIGTPENPITFTSVASAIPGEWYGIFIGGNNGMGSAHLNNAVVQYADWNFSIYSEEGAPITKIENTITRSSLYTGMEIYDSALHLVELDDVTFANNGGSNRIILREFDDNFSLGGNTTLKTQPGLEGYLVDFWNNDWGNFVIPAGITLTVEPGVSLYMERGGIDVNGRLEAIGTPSQPITFTSVTTNTYPWHGIVVNGGSAELAHAAINCSQQNGLSILNGSVSAICSTLTNNLGSGIFVDENAQDAVMLAYNSLAGNAVAGLRHEGSGWLDARYTWWGAADGPSGMGAGSGDAVTGSVLYQPWLTEPACHDVESVNLEVTQSASSAVIAPAETLTYTITVTNHAATTATQVVLTDTLPANVTVLAAPATCIGITELVCALADLTDGAQISFTIQIQANLTETAVLTNTIDVLAYQPDLDLSLNRSILTTIVQPEAPGWQIFLPFVIKSD
ncbi:MAG: DUF11 domain-containing protein [Chloroflexota bacterium]